MFSFLKKFFPSRQRTAPPTDPLAALAIDPDRSVEFVARLADSRIWLLAFGQQGTPNTERLSHDELLGLVAQNRKDLDDVGNEDSIVPFNFRRGSFQVLPFFSSVALAENFLAKENPKIRVIHRPFRIQAGFLTEPGLDKFRLVLNMDSSSERPLTSDERESLRQQVKKPQ